MPQALETLDLPALESQVAHFNGLVAKTPGIDHFCSSLPWLLSAREAFQGDLRPVLRSFRNGYLVLLETHHSQWGPLLLPLEASWCFACPLIGPDPRETVSRFFQFMTQPSSNWKTAFIPGMAKDSVQYREILHQFSPGFDLFHGPTVGRMRASLAGGLDGFLSRRSAKFRNNLRRAEKRCQGEHIEFRLNESCAQWSAAFQLFMEIESRSWKGLSQQGVDVGPMRDFYFKLMARHAAQEQVRWVVAYRHEEPVGYLMGAVIGGIYRGFQFSFDHRFANLSLGNLMQLRMIERCCSEGLDWYDLGSDIPYKRRWGETLFTTHSIIIRDWKV